MPDRSIVLCAVGDLLTDIVVHLERDPTRGTDTSTQITATRGGSAANVAVAVVAAGGSSRFVGQVGDDAAGYEHSRSLERLGVDVVVRHVGKTGTIVVLVDADGERTFLTDRGTSIALGNVDTAVLDDVDWLHIPGYSFLDGELADTSQRLVVAANERGIPVSISTSSVAALTEFGRQEFLELISAIRPRVVIANGDEARYVLRDGQRFPHTEWTVITRGERATSLVHSDGTRRSVNPEPVDAIDTTGAGDAFTGGFLLSLSAGVGAVQAVHDGHALAARTLLRTGAELADRGATEGERP